MARLTQMLPNLALNRKSARGTPSGAGKPAATNLLVLELGIR